MLLWCGVRKCQMCIAIAKDEPVISLRNYALQCWSYTNTLNDLNRFEGCIDSIACCLSVQELKKICIVKMLCMEMEDKQITWIDLIRFWLWLFNNSCETDVPRWTTDVTTIDRLSKWSCIYSNKSAKSKYLKHFPKISLEEKSLHLPWVCWKISEINSSNFISFDSFNRNRYV